MKIVIEILDFLQSIHKNGLYAIYLCIKDAFIIILFLSR